MSVRWIVFPLLAAALSADEIPKTWDAEKLAGFELPLAAPAPEVVYPSEAYYYSIPERKPWRNYQVYAPGREPDGYLDGLFERAPEPAFDRSKLQSDRDWIAAGKVIFESGGMTVVKGDSPAPLRATVEALVRQAGVPVAADGTLPHFRYTVARTGEVEIRGFMCVTCHARVQPDGSVILGAPTNLPVVSSVPPKGFDEELIRLLWSVPWLDPDPADKIVAMSGGEQVGVAARMPPGTLPRLARSFEKPMQIPDLIGVRDRRFLDWTGLRRHREIGDLMRYATLTADVDALLAYGDFIPAADARGQADGLPEPSKRERFSDAQLYALARYLYSLEPPKNPHQPDNRTRRGEQVFESEGCAGCHAPPVYTNNRLTPVRGFEVPATHGERYPITDQVVGTDPTIALETRGATGYYRVPSLRGLWYRGPYQHNGEVATLERWFDRDRLAEVPGHEFGLDLSAEDKADLIAFLLTL